MTTKELEMLETALRGARRYLEYGAGNSTRMASECLNLTHIRSVESDPLFVDQHVRCHDQVLSAEQCGRLSFRFVNLGMTGNWGHPRDATKAHLWPLYPLIPYQERADWDLVLVDGRFRVACVLLAALELPLSSTILVHDFWIRPEYAPMLHHMDVVGKADTLVQLRRRNDFNPIRAREYLRVYTYASDDRVRIPFLRRTFSALSRRSSRFMRKLAARPHQRT